MNNDERIAVENDRQYRVVDQSLSSHAALRDKYECRARWLNVTQVSVSLFLCAFAFMGDDVIASIGYDPGVARVTTGLIAIVILSLSIAEYVVDWKRQSGLYGEAADRLAWLKAQYRQVFSEKTGQMEVYERLTDEYNNVMGTLPRIPERYFAGLKAAHVFKRLVSQRISDNPKVPVWFVKLQLRIEGVFHAIKKEDNAGGSGGCGRPKRGGKSN